jgi:glycosyltransferase involved in cell wall biosynthesis
MNRKKKIAFIRPKAWPLANRIVEGVISEQFPDHEVDVLDVSMMVRKQPGLLLANSIATALLYGKDIAQRRKKFRLAFWRTPYIFRQIRKLVRERVARGEYSFSFQMQSLFDASTPGIPHFVYTDHTHLENLNYAAKGRASLYAPGWIELEKEIYRNAALTFVRSSNVRRSLMEDYGSSAEKAVLVYAGSNASVSSRKTDSDYAHPVILFVGLDWQRKGGPDLLEAFRIVHQACPDARLIILGAKPDVSLPNCEVVGKVPPEELDRYYQQASVFCLPTHLEPFGIAFIEAMTALLPIVATRVGAIPDFVEEGRNGWLVEPGDVPGLARALLKLVESPSTCKAFGEHSFHLTRERYSWQAVGKRFQQHIQRVLEESHKDRGFAE